ncbi:MAG: hypothetical protein NC310_03365 [Roseburia sp.]|nr:hypothetical protein [Anaeroplasma bactoclasticum]MCM1196099.1 hypothetical protein [Roseburia sp.]
MWKKVLYFGIAIIFGILIYIIGYSSNQMNHLEGIVKNAIEKEEYYKVPMVWGGCFDTKSIVDNNSDKLDIMIYPATSQTDVTYGDEENPGRYLEFERAYYLYIFNAKFSVDTVTDGTSSFNKTAIEFSSSDESSVPYDYYFIVDETMNSSVYVKEPQTKEEVLLNNTRDVTNTNSNWNFMRITFTETMLNQISKEMKGKITKLSVKDCDGQDVYTTDINLDFSQGFFENVKVKDMLEKYNTYLNAYIAADGDSATLKELNNTWGTQFDNWKKEFNEDIPNTGYAIGYERDIVTPTKLIWQTIGMLALYVVVIILFYILLFHFSAIKRLFSRENYKDYSRDSKIIVNGKAVSRTKGKPVKEIKTEDAIEPDTIVDEALETVTAGEVVSAPVVEEAEPETVSNEEEVAPVVEETVAEKPVEEQQTEEALEPVQEEKQPAEDAPIVESVGETVEEVKEAQAKPALKKPTAKKTTSASAKKTTTTKKPASKAKSTTVKKTTTKKKPDIKVEGD